MAMYIRVKRMKVTYFIQCDPTEKVLSIKQKLHAMIDELPKNQKLVLQSTQAVLDDSHTLAEQGCFLEPHSKVSCGYKAENPSRINQQKVENDVVVELSLRQENNEFDEPNMILPGKSDSSGN